jgi:hypothetical protein
MSGHSKEKRRGRPPTGIRPTMGGASIQKRSSASTSGSPSRVRMGLAGMRRYGGCWITRSMRCSRKNPR